MLISLTIILIITLPLILFMALSPQFGGIASQQQKVQNNQSPQFRKGKFANINDEKVDMSGGNFLAMIKEQFKSHSNTSPEVQPTVFDIDSSDIANYKGDFRMFWFGHSTFLIQVDGKTLIIDPMFGQTASPVPFGVKRFNKQMPIELDKLPKIDAILISHDHYDHLDYGSIQKLKDKTDQFYTPLGVGAHLEAWGVDKHRIKELDWWQSIRFDQLNLVCTPAQHFSGRGKWFSDQASTLWCSWIIQSSEKNIFFSGDSGYGAHFKAIGDKYGPFDMALMECGQYNELWKEIHMMPEETIQAGVDIGAKAVMPIHWGAFKLAMHEWTDPVVRASDKAKQENMPVITPQIGEGIVLNGQLPVTSDWWK